VSDLVAVTELKLRDGEDRGRLGRRLAGTGGGFEGRHPLREPRHMMWNLSHGPRRNCKKRLPPGKYWIAASFLPSLAKQMMILYLFQSKRRSQQGRSVSYAGGSTEPGAWPVAAVRYRV
jgi:hypothetical protein